MADLKSGLWFLFVGCIVGFVHTYEFLQLLSRSCSLDPTWTSCTLHQPYHGRDSGFHWAWSSTPSVRVFLRIDLSLISWSAISGNLLETGRVLPLCVYHWNCSVQMQDRLPLSKGAEATVPLSRIPCY